MEASFPVDVDNRDWDCLRFNGQVSDQIAASSSGWRSPIAKYSASRNCGVQCLIR